MSAVAVQQMPTPAPERPRFDRDAYERGLQRGGAHLLDGKILEDVALEVTLLRITVDALSRELEQRDRSIEWYRAKLVEFIRHVANRDGR